MSDTMESIARQRVNTTKRSEDDEERALSSLNGRSANAPPTSGNSIMATFDPFWDRFTRKGKDSVGVVSSLRAIAFSSWLNLFVVFIPIAWVAHFEPSWSPKLTFAPIIPLERLFDYGGEQMEFYLGKDLGDLLVRFVKFSAVEATLAIILLKKCDLKLLQSTIVGVVILHLLLIPGTAFITGGVRIMEQNLHPHLTQLNHTLLTIGVLTLLLPAASFAALDRGFNPTAGLMGIVNDETRDKFLQMSRGLSIILLAVYICSRIFLHDPPGDDDALALHPLAPEALKREEEQLATERPEVNQWVCVVMLIISIGIMAATAEWLVESIEFVREEGHIEEEYDFLTDGRRCLLTFELRWFGLILLPIVSFAADGVVAIVFFVRSTIHHFFHQPAPPATLAKARAIDLSIQFTLFWMPFIVLLGWWTNKPMSLLFDFFEVALLIGACFIVNYVTADAKTNWAEGFAMVAFYFMIALCAWFYSGQPEIVLLLSCPESVEEALAMAASGSTGHGE
ncbi:hypothetical protein BD779DRAFT_1667217 [Infundibulicybe gibba]|nr:hypothetical protein BD779DRAFT_1667217 [Infundibulicybe gibba]